MAKLAPAFREYAREQPAINSRLALEAKKIEAIERRTALMEREAAERVRKREATERAREAQKREAAERAREKEKEKEARGDKRVSKPSAEFAARRAEIEAILDTARTEIAEQLLLLCEQWQASSEVTVARCCAELSKLAKTLAVIYGA